MLGEEGSYSVLSDRAAIPPFGVGGGTSSRSYRVAVRRNGSENVFPTRARSPAIRCEGVTWWSWGRGGGGGYGDPLERDPEAVRTDVREGFVSAERAREGYRTVDALVRHRLSRWLWVLKTKGIMALVAFPDSAIGPAGHERPSPARAREPRRCATTGASCAPEPYAGAGAPGTGSLAMRFTSL